MITLLVATSALAGTLELGFGAGAALDLPDPGGSSNAGFGPGPSVRIPIRYAPVQGVWLRADARFDLATGADRVTWREEVDGGEVRVYDDDHFTMLLTGGLALGVDVEIPIDAPVRPYFGAEGGLGWFGTYHSFGGPTQVLLDPAQNDLGSSSNVDPYTVQLAVITDLHGGALYPLNEALSVGGEVGYAMTWLRAAPLKKTHADLDARREAYGWNPVRLGLSVHLSL